MGHNVLVVADDNEQLVNQLKQGFSSQYQLVPVSRGERAEELVRGIAFECIILARWISDVDSLSLLSKLKMLCKDMPILYVGEQATADFILDVWHAGASDFLHYPVNSAELEVCLSRILPPLKPISSPPAKVSKQRKRESRRKWLFHWGSKQRKSKIDIDSAPPETVLAAKEPEAEIIEEVAVEDMQKRNSKSSVK